MTCFSITKTKHLHVRVSLDLGMSKDVSGFGHMVLVARGFLLVYVTWFGFVFGFGELQVRFGFEFSDGVRMGFGIDSSIYIFQNIYIYIYTLIRN